MAATADQSRTSDLVESFLNRLDRVARRAGGWTARCPAHEDANPSLSISLADDGSVLTHCFAGCSRSEILAALDLDEQAIHPAKSRPAPGRSLPMVESPKPRRATLAGALTIDDLAAAKHLPIELLKEAGCRNVTGSGVAIPYFEADGDLTSLRTRMALVGRRFRWRRGDHPLPYGLWRLESVREAGWVLVVEGESDCWTAWHHGLPAIGVPGTSTWRPEWAKHLIGLDVVVWQEPGAEDLVTRIAADLPDARVIVAPPGIKDISEAHVRGEDVAALVNRLVHEAPPVQSLGQQRARDRQLAAHQAAQPVLAHRDALELVEAELLAQGYGGDLRGPLLGYLAATTRVLAWRRGSILSHLLFIGPSSGGKNAAIQAALRLVPDEAVHVIDAASPRVLIYDDTPLEHRIVVFSEADSLPAGEDNPAASAIRDLLQDGRLHYQVTIPDATTGSYKVHKVDKPGPTVLITTSTRPLGHQLVTRLFTVEIPDETAQLRAALAAQAALELDDPPPPNEALIAFQRYLGSLAPIDVVVPFAHSIQVALGDHPPGPRVLRDFPRLLSLIKAVAVLRIAHRSRDARDRLVADVDDFRAVHRLVADSYETSAGASRRIRDTVGAVAELSTAKGPGGTVTVTEVAKRLEVSNPSASRRVHAAVEGKWLVNDEPRPSQTAKLRIGEPLPATSSLPTPEAISECYARASSGVFTLSPDPAASLPSTHGVGDQGGRLLPVSPENVKSGGVPPPIPPPLPLNFGIFADEEEWGMGPA